MQTTVAPKSRRRFATLTKAAEYFDCSTAPSAG